MGCCDELVATLPGVPLDPSQHVNYTRGMVLGVDDFTQEFAYLAGRQQWLAREAIGYGTVSGLRVFAEDDGDNGPRLHVTAGSALTPSGQLICVTADQCALLNKWLAKSANAAIVNRLLNPGVPDSPPVSPPLSPPAVTSGTISLYLTLCYADCRTRPVPIPGEPCRSEDDLMAESRVADDFRLELHEAPPAQVEEDALRDFVRWLRANVQVVGGGSAIGDDASWLDALRPGAQPWFDAVAMSPPVSPPASFETLGDYLIDLPSPGIAVDEDQLCAFLRVAFRFWVTELRPLWMAYRCHLPRHGDTDCVLLARATFPVTFVGGSPVGVWQVDGAANTVAIDETTRPMLTHQRLLQEWMLCGCDCAWGAAGDSGLPNGLPAPAAMRVAVSSVTTNNQTLLANQHVVLCNGITSINLPRAAASTLGRIYILKNVGTSLLRVRAFNEALVVDSIDGLGTTNLRSLYAKTFVSDGNGRWHVIGKVP
jgi:hypothetical protein